MRSFVEVPTVLRRHWRTVAMLLMCGAAGWAQAQSAAFSDATDPPSRVARLSYLAGDVGLLPAGAATWSDASINRPLTTGDRLSTGAGARAEMEFGGSNLRMDGDTDFGVLDLNEQVAQIELTQGTLGLSVRDLGSGQNIEIDTPTVALVVDRPGSLRVDVGDGARGTRISVLEGSAVVYGENSAQRNLVAGRSYRFDDSALSSVVISDLGGGDGFDAWGRDRDQRYAQSVSRQYVSDAMVGYQDLDQYGDWQTDNDYGAVWYPTQVSSTWAPYSDGHWAYIAPWGWSWVDSSAWGFAPYHYGRWANMRGRWGWIPGPMDVRPIYAPALVAFVGGGGWSVGIGNGPVGWFPLGPGEIYNPWYRTSRNYYTNVNITNIYVRRGYDRSRYHRDIDNHYDHYRRDLPVRGESYVNRHAPRGFTAVSGRTFASGQQVRGGVRQVDQRELATAAVLPRGIAARPAAGRTALPRNAHTRSLPVGGFDRAVVARRAPSAGFVEPVDASTRTPRGGSRGQLATPARVRLLTPEVAGAARSPAQRVLSTRVADAADARPADTSRFGARNGVSANRVEPVQERVEQQRANRELVRNRDAAAIRPMPAGVGRLPNVAPIRPADEVRSGELRSAGFARSARRMAGTVTGESRSAGAAMGTTDRSVPAATAMDSRRNQRDGSQRPGLSIIPRDNTERATPSVDNRDVSVPQRLPQAQRFQRGVMDDAGGLSAERRAEFAGRQRVMPENPPMGPRTMQRNELPARFERPQSTRSTVAAMPQMEAPRQPNAAPVRQYQPQREVRNAPVAMPQPRMTVPPPRRERAAPADRESNARRASRPNDRPQQQEQQN